VDCGLGEYVLYMFTVCKASIKCPGICHELCIYDAPDMRTIRAWITNTSSTLKKVKKVDSLNHSESDKVKLWNGKGHL